MNTQDYIKMEDEFGAHNYHPLDVVINKAKGVWVWDVEGKKYMDCLAAYSAVNQGHCHPEIMKVFLEQAQKVTLTSRAFRNDKLPLLYKKLHDMTGYDMFLPMNSVQKLLKPQLNLHAAGLIRLRDFPRTKQKSLLQTATSTAEQLPLSV